MSDDIGDVTGDEWLGDLRDVLQQWTGWFGNPTRNNIGPRPSVSNAIARSEIRGERQQCWQDGNYVNNIGRCVPKEEALEVAFRNIENLQDSDNVRRDRIEAYILGSFYDELADAGGNEEDIVNVLNKYNDNGFMDSNQWIQETLASTGSATSVITGTVDNAILEDMIRKAAIGDGIFGGEVDFEDLPGYGGIWEGLIRHIKVIGKGLPFPIPDWLPLPGIFELPTVGDIFDTVTGPWKTAAEDALRDCVDTGKSASQCLEEQSVIDILTDGIGNATSDIYDATAEKVQEILDKTIDCASNPSTCAQEVFDKLKDIFGEGAVDPTSTGGNIPDWMKVIIIGGTYGDEILGELEDLFGGDIVGVGPEEPEECANGAINYPQCDQCPEGQQLENGQCVETPPWQDTGPSPQECSNQNRAHVPGDTATQTPSSCGECLTGFEEVGEQCQEEEDPVTNNGPTAAECAAENREFNPPTDVEDSSCGDCLSGFVETAEGCVEDTGPEECSNGAIDPGTCSECEDATTPDEHQGGDCRNELINTTDPFDCADGKPEGYSFDTQRWYRECSADYCYDGTRKQTVDGVYGANCEEYVPEENPCDDPQYAAENPLECGGDPEDPVEECQDPNRNKKQDGTCADTCTNGSLAPETGLCPEPLICNDPNATNYNGSGACEYDDCINGATDPENGCVTCPTGMVMGTNEDGMEACVDDGLSETCDNGKTVESGCQECPEGTTDDGAGGCQQVYVCDDPNATVVSGGPTEGACGPCKPGYVYDGGPEKCVKDGCPEGQIENEDGSCSFIPIDCPEEAKQFCESSGTCDRPLRTVPLEAHR